LQKVLEALFEKFTPEVIAQIMDKKQRDKTTMDKVSKADKPIELGAQTAQNGDNRDD
jgi:hypothetical protein